MKVGMISIAGWSPELKKRYNFALSAFSRMYGTSHITMEMMHFSYKWADSDNNHPEGTLTHIDFYFRDLWTNAI
jgi:hypothetical protein